MINQELKYLPFADAIGLCSHYSRTQKVWLPSIFNSQMRYVQAARAQVQPAGTFFLIEDLIDDFFVKYANNHLSAPLPLRTDSCIEPISYVLHSMSNGKRQNKPSSLATFKVHSPLAYYQIGLDPSYFIYHRWCHPFDWSTNYDCSVGSLINWLLIFYKLILIVTM